MSFYSVLSALSVSISLVCPRFLLVLALCLSLLALLHGLSLRMLLASFFGTSSLGHTPLLLLHHLLPRLCLPLPHLCLPLRLQLFGLTVSVVLLLLGPSLVTLLFLLSWRLLLGLPLLYLRPSTSNMFSSPRLMVLVWVLWWRLIMLYNWLRFSWVLGFGFYVPFSAGSGASREEGRCSSPHVLRRVCSLLKEFRVWLSMPSVLLVQ